jgi:colicin import membrane protein
MSRQAYRDEYPMTPPRERGTWRALALAIMMHALLFWLLWHGIHWQNSTPAGTEAELWTPDETVQQVQPTPPPAPPVVTPPPQPDDAEIALQQAKQKQEEAERQAALAEQARQQQLQQQLQQEAEQRLQQQREEQARQDALKAEQQKKLLAQQQQQQLAKQAEQAKEQQQKDEAKKAAEALKAKQLAEAQAKAKLDKQRQANLAALRGLAGTAPNGEGFTQAGTGSGAGGNGSAGYADKVRRKVLPNVTFGGAISDNPEAVVTVNCAPDGTVLSASISRPSNNPAWDAAVLRAVQLSSPMPRDVGGTAPHSFTITFKPKNG